MNLTTTKHLPLLLSFTLLAACSAQNTSGTGGGLSNLGGQLLGEQQAESSGSALGGRQSAPGSQNSAGQQSIPGSQLIGQQKKSDKEESAKKIQQKPKVATSSSSMRKIVLKAPKKTIKPIVVSKPSTAKPRTTTSTPLTPRETYNKVMAKRAAPIRPSGFVGRPSITQPFRTPTIANPVRSAPVRRVPVRPATPIRPVARPPVRPVVRPAPVVAPAPVKKPQNTLRRLTLNGSANFKSGSSRLTARGQTKLLGLSLNLQEGSTQITRLLIEGHTDSVGNATMNQTLSLKRANAVAEYLADKGGFTRSIMDTVGLGESKPVASNKTRKGRAQNRRVEITATGTRQINR